MSTKLRQENKRLKADLKQANETIKTLQDKFTNAKAFLDEKLSEIGKTK